MILLDTNVISEAMKPSANPVVIDWLNDQPAETLFVSTVTMAELLFGIASLPAGKRKNTLTGLLDRLLGLFHNRILAFDVQAAQHYALLAARAREAGRGFPTADGYIAAIASAHGFYVATRDTAPFTAAGVPVINPWQGAGPAGEQH